MRDQWGGSGPDCAGPRGHSHEQWEAIRRFGAGDDTIPVHILQRRLWRLWAEWAAGASVETGKPVRACSVTRGDGCLDEARLVKTEKEELTENTF